MCGIAGIVRLRSGQVKGEEIESLTSFLRHRGPDGSGVWLSGDQSLGLGHARLSILDRTEGAAQPMLSHNSRYVIAYNGEVYNFLEIGNELRKLGRKFRSDSDTEVILSAYERWGVKAFEKFNGMWALAIYDTVERKLILSRDRFGVKPLYYYIDNDIFVFSSEIQAIQRFMPSRLGADWKFLGRMCQFDFSVYSEEHTYLDSVRAVPAGFVASLADGMLTHRQWYWLQRIEVPNSYEDQVASFSALLHDSCRIRLRSDVPVATCLSGGIDSGSIVSILGQFNQPESPRFHHFSHTAFTAEFPDSYLDETRAAMSVAKSSGMKFNQVTMSPPSPDELERGMRACDGPMPSMAFFPIWRLYEYIKRNGVSVTLDGQGADEMLGGYYLGYAAMRGAMQKLNIPMLRDLYDVYGNINEKAKEWIDNDLRSALHDTLQHCDQCVKEPIKRLAAFFGVYEKRPSRLRKLAPAPRLVHSSQRGANWLESALQNQVFLSPLPFLLYQYDRCSMASGVECRMPFMDYRLMEFVFSLPLRSRIGHGYTKRVLRDAVKNILIEPVRTNRIKTGFNAPFGQWLQGPLKSWAMDITDTSEFRDLPDVDAKAIRKTLESSKSASDSGLDEREVWSKIHAAFWLRQSKELSNV